MKNLLVLSLMVLAACTGDSTAVTTTSIVPKSATAEEFVQIWNDLINKQDWDNLATLYAPTVYIYAKKKPKAYCIAAKKKYMEANPSFQQKIENVYGNQVYYQSESVSFDKTYVTAAGVEKKATTILGLVKNEKGYWEIREETDLPTWRKNKTITSCEKFWRQLIRTNKDIKAYAASSSYLIEMYFHRDQINVHIRDNGEYTSATIDKYVFSIKDEKLYHTGFKENFKEGTIVSFDTSLYRRLGEFCN